jgi:flagellar biosynthetic protein FliR
LLSYEELLPHVPGFAAVLSRVTGIFVFTPLLSSAALPRKVRVAISFALAVAIYPIADVHAVAGQTFDLIELLVLVAGELLIGAAIGLIATIPLMSVQLGGLLMGQQMGLGMAQVVDPAMDIEGDNLGQILFIIAVATFVSIGGMEALFAALVMSFTLVPSGGVGMDVLPLEPLVGLVQSGFVLALRIAMPVLAIIFVENLAVGFLMKTVPSLNIMSFGFPVRVLLGLIAAIAGLTAMGVVIGDEIVHALLVMEDWLAGLAVPENTGVGG